MCEEKILHWINITLANHGLSANEIKIEGESGKNENFGSDIHFVSVTGLTRGGAKKTFNLVVKSSKESHRTNKEVPIRQIFLKEIFIYDKVKTAFDNLQKNNRVQQMIQVLPYCYGTHVTEEEDVIVLENLKADGYVLMDNTKPWSWEATELALKAYGQWHALSFAMKALSPEIFKKLIENNVNMFSWALVKLKCIGFVAKEFVKSKEMMIFENREDVLKHLDYSENDVLYALTDMLVEDRQNQVILHSDCWNNNFLLRFDEDSKIPSQIRILDWQASGVGSPVFDLSHFIYACTNTEEYKDVNKLLQVYHSSLSETLKLFGSEADKIFSYNALLDQWKKFSRYGLFLSSWIFKLAYCNYEETSNSVKNDDEFAWDTLNFPLTDEKMYKARVRSNFVHYCKNIEL